MLLAFYHSQTARSHNSQIYFMEPKKPVPRFAILREQAGLTQLEIAQLLNVTENTFANWEKNRSGLKWIVAVVNLCKIFNCKAEDLIEYVVDNQPVEPSAKQRKIAELHRRLNADRRQTD